MWSMVGVLLSPSKTLDFETEARRLPLRMPVFQSKAVQIAKHLKPMNAASLGRLLAISPKLASLNVARYDAFVAKPSAATQRHAITAYQGDTYVGFDAASCSDKALQQADQHVAILSGLYGVLHPLDAIQAYRLEMGTKLSVGSASNLYAFWRVPVTRYLNEWCHDQGHRALVACASKEYLDVVDESVLQVPLIHCDFKEIKNGKAQTIGLFAKRARGMMARFIVDHKIRTVSKLHSFDEGGYRFDAAQSTETKLIFTRKSVDQKAG